MNQQELVNYFATKIEAEWGPYDLQHALEKNRDNVVILDTRAPEAFAEEHIPNAINIPEAELDARMKEIPKSKDVVPYCWSVTCHLATRVALKLAQNGYKVHELAGGIGTWKEYKMDVSSSKKEPASVA